MKRKDKKLGAKNIDLVVRAMIDKAKKGNTEALKLLIERLWGKTPENVHISGHMGNINIDVRELMEIVKDDPDRARKLAATLRNHITDSTGS